MLKRLSAMLGVAIAALTVPASHTATIANPSFETPSLSCSGCWQYDPSGAGVVWNFVGNAGISNGGPWFDNLNTPAPDGSQAAFIQTAGTSSSINQTIGNLTVGDIYQVTLSAIGRPGFDPAPITISMGGVSIGTLNAGNYDAWDQYSPGTFSPSSTSEVLQFTATDDGSGSDLDTNIDNVQVNIVGACQSGTVIDSSFENLQIGSGNFYYNPSPGACGWVFNGNTGLSADGGPFYDGSAPDGDQAAFLQYQAGDPAAHDNISQTLYGLIPGDVYSFSFYAADRDGYNPAVFTVLIDGTGIGDFTPGSTSFTQFTTGTFVATSSDEVLEFAADVSSSCIDCDSAIDQVQITDLSGTPEPSPALLIGGGMVLMAIRRRRGPAI